MSALSSLSYIFFIIYPLSFTMKSKTSRTNVLEDSIVEKDTVEEELLKRTHAFMAKISSPVIRSAGTQRTPLKFTHSELIKLHWIVGYKQAAKLTWEKVFTKASLGMLFTREYRNVLWKLNDHKNRGESEEKILELIDLASKYDPRKILVKDKLDEVQMFHQNIYSDGSFVSAYQNLHDHQMDSFVEVHPEIIKRNLCVHFGLPYTGDYREEKSEDSTEPSLEDSDGECDKRFESIEMPTSKNDKPTSFTEGTISRSGLVPNEMVADKLDEEHAEKTVRDSKDDITQEIQPENTVAQIKDNITQEIQLENTVAQIKDNITQEIQFKNVILTDESDDVLAENTDPELKDNITHEIQTSCEFNKKENLPFEQFESTEASKENFELNDASTSVIINPESKFTSNAITIEEFPFFTTQERLNGRLLRIEKLLLRSRFVPKSLISSSLGQAHLKPSEEELTRFLDKLVKLKLITVVKTKKSLLVTLYKED